MESHSFVIVEAFNDDSEPRRRLATWKVLIMRKGVEDPVGTILVTEQSLPPRKRKGKVVWRLPDTIETNPKFGEHERKRLWELFKQQKKERRKKKGGGGLNSIEFSSHTFSENGDTGSGDEEEDQLAETTEEDMQRSTKQNPKPGVSMPKHHEHYPTSYGRSKSVEEERKMELTSPGKFNGNPPRLSSSPLALPPGFNVANLSLEETESMALPPATGGNPTSPAVTTGLRTTIVPPPGMQTSGTSSASHIAFSAPLRVPGSASEGTAAQPPPDVHCEPLPPLGLPTAPLRHRIPQHSAPPPGLQSPIISPNRLHQQNETSSTSSHAPAVVGVHSPSGHFHQPAYFRFSQHEPITALGSHVATTLTRLIPAGLVSEWLAHYSVHAVCALLMGTAQVVSVSAAEKMQAWISLSANAALWECQGWTTLQTSVGIGNGSGSAAMGALVVVTGRTVQKTEPLAFTLTLVLVGRLAGDGYYYHQIENDVLSLALLNKNS